MLAHLGLQEGGALVVVGVMANSHDAVAEEEVNMLEEDMLFMMNFFSGFNRVSLVGVVGIEVVLTVVEFVWKCEYLLDVMGVEMRRMHSARVKASLYTIPLFSRTWFYILKTKLQ